MSARSARKRVGALLDVGQHLVDGVGVERARLGVAAARELRDHVREERAAGRERAGRGGQQHALRAELARDRDDVEARGAAAGDERVLARVDALRDRDLADRADHVLGRDRQGGVGGLLDAHAERLADRLQDAARGVGVERQQAAEEVGRVDPAEHDGGVRDGRLACRRARSRRGRDRRPRSAARRAGGRRGRSR